MTRWYTTIILSAAFFLGTVAATTITGCTKVPPQVASHSNTTAAEEATAVPEIELPETDADVEEPEVDAPPAPPEVDSAAEDQPADDESELPSGEPDQTPAEPLSTDSVPAETTESVDPESAQVDEQVESVETSAQSPVDKSANPVIEPGDWAQWGGTSYRNNTPVGENIPIDWKIGDFDRDTQEWIPDEAENIKWVSRLGSQTYGNPVVAGGRVYVGTNNSAGWMPRYPADIDLGCLLAFSEEDGTFLWQDSSEKLPTGRVHDWPLQGICCAPYVEGDRLWFVTSRGEVKCLDTEGFYDGEDDGPVQDQWARLFDLRKNEDASRDQVGPIVQALNEGQVSETLRDLLNSRGAELSDDAQVEAETPGKKWLVSARIDEEPRQLEVTLTGPQLSVFKLITPDDQHESDVVWVYDMMSEQKVSQHNMASCSVTALGDILFVNTSNGVDESHVNIPSSDAASFMAMNKTTGKVYWTDSSPGLNILHGQWSSPTVAILGGVPQVIFAGGDGWVYSFRADEGENGKPELLWKFDANPKESKWILGGRGTRNNIIATPVVYDGLVYVAVGQDPEHGEGIGHLWCLNPHKRGDVSPELAMRIENDKRVPIAHRRLQAVNPEEGEVAVDNPNSAVLWHFSEFDQNGDGEIDFEETMHRSCGTVAIKDDLLFISDFSGLFHCLDAKTGKVHWSHDMLAAAWGSPLIIEGHVYIGDEDGDVSIFNLSADPREAMKDVDGELVPINTDESGYPTNMGNSVYSTPIVANNVLYIANKTHLFAIGPTAQSE